MAKTTPRTTAKAPPAGDQLEEFAARGVAAQKAVDAAIAAAGQQPPEPARAETARVVVVVNHNQLRRGDEGDVELTPDVRRLVDKGYLRVIGPATGKP